MGCFRTLSFSVMVAACLAQSRCEPANEQLEAVKKQERPCAVFPLPKSNAYYEQPSTRNLLEKALDWVDAKLHGEKVFQSITSRWGAPRGERQHQGIDLAAPAGTPVLAPFDCTVTQTGSDENTPCGLSLTCQSLDGARRVRFCHLDPGCARPEPDESKVLPIGTPLACVGNTGTTSTGAHLHMEIYAPSIVDPEKSQEEGGYGVNLIDMKDPASIGEEGGCPASQEGSWQVLEAAFSKAGGRIDAVHASGSKELETVDFVILGETQGYSVKLDGPRNTDFNLGASKLATWSFSPPRDLGLDAKKALCFGARGVASDGRVVAAGTGCMWPRPGSQQFSLRTLQGPAEGALPREQIPVEIAFHDSSQPEEFTGCKLEVSAYDIAQCPGADYLPCKVTLVPFGTGFAEETQAAFLRATVPRKALAVEAKLLCKDKQPLSAKVRIDLSLAATHKALDKASLKPAQP